MKLEKHIAKTLDEHDVLHVFGLILFTDEHPHVVKVLSDDDYWKQFDTISGKSFAIFSAKPVSGSYRHKSPAPGQLGLMKKIWQEPSENKELLSIFQLATTKDLPVFVVFARLTDDTLAQCFIPLTDENLEAAHHRLKRVIDTVSAIAKEIDQSYKMNVEGVFDAFELQISHFKDRETLKKAVQWLPFLSQVIKLAFKS